MTFDAAALILILLLSTILAGYAAGRRMGLREGYRAGLAEAPLLLKEKALLADMCPVCGTCSVQPFTQAP